MNFRYPLALKDRDNYIYLISNFEGLKSFIFDLDELISLNDFLWDEGDFGDFAGKEHLSEVWTKINEGEVIEEEDFLIFLEDILHNDTISYDNLNLVRDIFIYDK